MNIKPLPFMSIVVCTYNGAETIGTTLRSLVWQDYPADRFEVIVVDDGSTDETKRVVSRFPVIYLRQAQNGGLAKARNTGLEIARGDVYVNFDDDCIARPDWLMQLATQYSGNELVAGVAGKIESEVKKPSLTDRFMIETGCGDPAPFELDSAQSPIRRLLAYVSVRLRPAEPVQGIVKVRELNGANASFPVWILHAVGGWDEKLSGVEDTDISRRIMKRFEEKGYHFYFTPEAVIAHTPHLSLTQYLARPIKRGPVNLRYYLGHSLTPPVFPFPFVWAAAVSGSIFLGWPFVLFSIFGIPQLLYSWWPLRFLREGKIWMLLFPYIQLSEEIGVLIGLWRGYRQLRSRRG